jgi:hypothetical protein
MQHLKCSYNDLNTSVESYKDRQDLPPDLKAPWEKLLKLCKSTESLQVTLSNERLDLETRVG